MPYVNCGELDIYYEIHGDGPPLLLLAGLASDSQSWLPILDKLAARFRVVVFDNRGVGRTTPQDAPSDIPRMAEDCIALARVLDIEKFNLLGHSMGGLIALEIALRFPAYVDRLIVAAATARVSARNRLLFADWSEDRNAGMDPGRWFRNFFYWIFTPRFFESEANVQGALDYALNYPYPQSEIAFAHQVNAMTNFDCRDKASEIQAKTLVLAGEYDLLFPPRECRDLAKSLPHAEFSSITGSAHSIFIENAEDFIAAVAGFLERTE